MAQLFMNKCKAEMYFLFFTQMWWVVKTEWCSFAYVDWLLKCTIQSCTNQYVHIHTKSNGYMQCERWTQDCHLTSRLLWEFLASFSSRCHRQRFQMQPAAVVKTTRFDKPSAHRSKTRWLLVEQLFFLWGQRAVFWRFGRSQLISTWRIPRLPLPLFTVWLVNWDVSWDTFIIFY